MHLRASQINGCSVCVDMHPKIARKAGETDERLFAVSAWRDAPYFSDAERAALALTEAVTRLADREDPCRMRSGTRPPSILTRRELATLILSIATINVWNRLNATIKMPVGVWKVLSADLFFLFLLAGERRRSYSARNLFTTSPNSSGACSNIQWPAFGDHRRLAARDVLGQHAPHHRQAAVVSPPPISSVGVLIACASALRVGLALLVDLAEEGERVVAQLLLGRRRQAPPRAVAVDALDEILQRALDVAGPDHLDRAIVFAASGGWRGRDAAASAGGVEIAAGLGQHQLAQQVRPLLRDAKRDVPAARMAHQVDRLRVDLLDEGDGVGDMLRHPVVVADAVPMLGKEMPQADRDHAMLFDSGPSTEYQVRKSPSVPCTQTSGWPSPTSR